MKICTTVLTRKPRQLYDEFRNNFYIESIAPNVTRQGLKAFLPMPYNYLKKSKTYFQALFIVQCRNCSTVPMQAEIENLIWRVIFNSDLI